MESNSLASVPTKLRLGHILCAMVTAALMIVPTSHAFAADGTLITPIVTVQSIDVPTSPEKKDDSTQSQKASPDADGDGLTGPSDNETGRTTEQPWEFPAPGCPYEEGPLDLIV